MKFSRMRLPLAGVLAALGVLVAAPTAGAICSGTCGPPPPTTHVTSTSLVLSPSSIQYGEPASFTASVKDETDTTLTPTGSVDFMNGSTKLGSGNLSAGTTTISAPTFPVGVFSITADYNGTATDDTSSSAPATFTVNKDATATSLSASKSTSNAGEPVTFTATVTAPYDDPTSTVTFADGSTTLGSATLSAGKATFTTSTLAAGSHSITATYGGDSGNASSSSNTLTQTVNAHTTSTAVSSSLNPSEYGQSVTFTATVSDSTVPAATPSGTVTFWGAGKNLGSVNLNGGQASISTASLPQGINSVEADYAGGGAGGEYAASIGHLSQTVSKDPTTTTLTSSNNPANVGDPVKFTATVTAPYDSPTLGVTFYDGSTSLGTVALSGGTATLTTSTLAAGSHSIQAVYIGDGDNATSSSSGLTQTVNAPAPSGGGGSGGSGGSSGGSGGSSGGSSGSSGGTGSTSSGGSSSTTGGTSTTGSLTTGSGAPKSSVKAATSGPKCTMVLRKGKGKGKIKVKVCTKPKPKTTSRKHKKH